MFIRCADLNTRLSKAFGETTTPCEQIYCNHRYLRDMLILNFPSVYFVDAYDYSEER
jgi:hypothetical protein